MRKLFWLVLILLTALGVSWAQTAPVTVFFNPSSQTVNVGQTFTVNIVADIPNPVLGWGLDVNVDPARLIRTGVVVNDPPWSAVAAGDGDDLAGLALPPVSGNGVVLATLTFQAQATGTVPLIASVTADDLTEGFPLVSSGFATINFIPGSVTVAGGGAPTANIPALSPLGLALLASLLGMIGVKIRRRK